MFCASVLGINYSLKRSTVMSIQLPVLPFSTDALKPFFSQKSLETHFEKHHLVYVDKLNELIKNTYYDDMTLEDIVLTSFSEDASVFRNAAQAWNHDFFWHSITSLRKSNISDICFDKLSNNFKSLENFKKEFIDSALSVFGSGWTWLVINQDGTLSIENYANADCPLMHAKIPVLTCDLWEHSYYLDYQSDRKSYMNHFMEIINWNFVEKNLNARSILIGAFVEASFNSSSDFYN
jgi:Fe-Mn family superoxide dismutase